MNSPHQLLSGLQHTQLLNYMDTASTAVLVYDYFLTLPREVSLVWSARPTYVKYLYLLIRYLPIVDVAIRIHRRSFQYTDAESCLQTVKLSVWFLYVGTILPEFILTVRTWAVWGRDRRLSIGLPIFFVLCWVPCIWVIIEFLNDYKVLPGLSPTQLGCSAMATSRNTFLCWVLLLIYEAGIFLLMLIQGIKIYKCGGNSRLFHAVFRNGLLYYLALFMFAFANVLFMVTEPGDKQSLLVLAERFVHTIVACRVILDIRGQVADTEHSSWLGSTTDEAANAIAFAPSSTSTTDTRVPGVGQTSINQHCGA